MPTYSISAPDGNTYKIEGPAGATQEQVKAEVLKQNPSAGTPKAVKPEVGNMYTQSAEDIQYSPEGIPLNTSSYGSAPTGVTKSAQQALTSTVSLPINVATGVAKAPAALLQAYDKLIGGGKTGDTAVNVINQIESGTQNQMGGVGGAINQVGSAVGQAAPFMIGGGAIGQIPSFAKNLATGVGMGAMSGVLTPEQTGLTPEQFINAKTQNVGIQSAIGGAFPVAGKLVNALRGTPLSPQMASAVEKARETGYTVPPTQAGGGIANRLLEGMAGKISTLQEASVRNQAITDKLAKKSLGLSEDVALTPEILKGVRDEAGKVYDGISNAGIIIPTKSFNETLDKIGENAVKAEMNFPNATSKQILDVVGSLRKNAFDSGSAVSRIKQLRTEADMAYRAGNTELGSATKAAANALEDAIESHLSKLNQPDALNKFKEARQLIAKTYTVEKAMNKTTGTVDAKNLASRLQAGKPMSGELKDIAQFAQAFPKASQMPEKIGGTIGISPLDYTVAGLTGGASLLGGEDKASSTMNSLIALLARPGARKLVLSAPMQNRLVQQQVSAPSAIRNALPSTEEQKQLAKMLLMQSAGQAAQ
jgi:hypothetical protein